MDPTKWDLFDDMISTNYRLRRDFHKKWGESGNLKKKWKFFKSWQGHAPFLGGYIYDDDGWTCRVLFPTGCYPILLKSAVKKSRNPYISSIIETLSRKGMFSVLSWTGLTPPWSTRKVAAHSKGAVRRQQNGDSRGFLNAIIAQRQRYWDPDRRRRLGECHFMSSQVLIPTCLNR